MSSLRAAVEPSGFLRLIAHEVRWEIVTTLAHSDLRVQDLVLRLGKPINLVSYHLAKLRGARLVRERRSDADSRDVYYGLDLDRMRQLYAQAGNELHPGLMMQGEPRKKIVETPAQTSRVLFLCTENSARSQMAEGILRHIGRGQVETASAGSSPTHVHPLAVQVLAVHGIDISRHRSKSIDELQGQTFDYVITVCDRIKESCPAFPSDPERIHWSFADPASVVGDEERRRLAFQVTAKELMTMTRYLVIMIERSRKEAE